MEYKEETEFYYKDKAHTKLNSKCKKCSNAMMTQLRKDRYEKVAEYKSTKGCKICGERRHWVLDLHHRDGDEKERTVSRMISKNICWDKILLEINKCDVLCSNCHRDYHYKHK